MNMENDLAEAVMNGLITKDVFEKQKLNSTLVSSLTCPSTSPTISQQAVDNALRLFRVLDLGDIAPGDRTTGPEAEESTQETSRWPWTAGRSGSTTG